jgi:hypothetical protein
MTVKTDQEQKSHLFKKGQSGNPSGRPTGSRHKATIAALTLLEGESEALTRKAIDAALGGDMIALRMCLDRIVAPVKDRPVSVVLPQITDASDLPKITGALLAAVAAGKIGPSEAVTLAKLVDVHRGALEIADITERITKLENEVKR